MSKRGYAQFVGSMFAPPLPPKTPDEAPSGVPVAAGRNGRPDDAESRVSQPASETETKSEEPPGSHEKIPAQKMLDEETAAASSDETRVEGQPELHAPEASGQGEDEPEPPPDLTPEGLTITDLEKALLKRLLPLVSTPRSAKRMVNIYRLIRVSLFENDLADFVQESPLRCEFVAVQILLGILLGFPALAPDVFRTLQDTTETSFWKYLEALRPKISEGSTSSRNFAREDLGETEILSWNQFCDALETLKQEIESEFGDAMNENEWQTVVALQSAFNMNDSLATYQKWSNQVARYSFHAGHVVSTIARRRG